MPAQWTGRLIGDIHNAGLTLKRVSAEAGYHDKYVSTVLNAEKENPKVEGKMRSALERLKEAKANAKEES